jgi:predicted RNase H-like nuclease (RuvC/YqgF family)
MADEPTTELQRAVERLTATIDQLRHELVRKDVYESDQRGRDREIADLREDVRETRQHVKNVEDKQESDRKETENRRTLDRRLVLSALVFPVLILVLQLWLSTVNGGPT